MKSAPFISFKIFYLFGLLILILCCKPDTILLSSENNIISVHVDNHSVELDFDPINNLITLTIPFDFENIDIPVAIKTSPGSIHSLSGISSINIINTRSITVTAEDGSVKNYEVRILRKKNDENLILEFILEIGDENYNGIIDNNNNTIKIEIPSHTDITNLVPQIKLSEGSSISPSSNITINFEENTSLKVTSESGITRDYEVVFSEIESDANFLLDFKFQLDESLFLEGIIIQDTKTVEITVPCHFDITNLSPIVEISECAEISITPGSFFNFENNNIFVVTAENGAQRSYVVNVIREENTANFILSFSFINSQNKITAEIIEDINNIIFIEVPFDLDLSAIKTEITVSENAIVSPNSGLSQNFNNEIKYTVTSKTGISRIYTIKVLTEKSNENYITSFNINFNSEEIKSLSLALKTLDETLDSKTNDWLELSEMMA